MHSRPGEKASETPSLEILHRERADKVFGGVSRHGFSLPFPCICVDCSTISSTLAHVYISFDTMASDDNAMVGTLPDNTYVLLFSLFA